MFHVKHRFVCLERFAVRLVQACPREEGLNRLRFWCPCCLGVLRRAFLPCLGSEAIHGTGPLTSGSVFHVKQNAHGFEVGWFVNFSLVRFLVLVFWSVGLH